MGVTLLTDSNSLYRVYFRRRLPPVMHLPFLTADNGEDFFVIIGMRVEHVMMGSNQQIQVG